MPYVSILMTVYNGMPYLPLAVNSALGQSLRDVRFVIVNDGSTDDTANYLARITDPRVVVLYQTNQGTGAAANHGLAHCNTEFVARMDSDDISLPTRLATQLDFLRANPKVGLVGTQVAPMGKKRSGGSLRLPLSHSDINSALLAGRHGLAHSSIMFRTELLRRIGGYWSLRMVDDWDMMLRMGEAAELANLDQLLHYYRVHPGSLNGSGMKRMRLSIDFACEVARRRRAGKPPISIEEFQTRRRSRPLWLRGRDHLHAYALSQYRMAVAEQCGGRPVRGSLRLAWAATCAPHLTAQRVQRMLRRFAHPSASVSSRATTSSIGNLS
jgi:glycosyltransferase involved in cell wall biosynthesis